MEIVKLEGIASQVRRDIVRMVSAVNSGHPGGSLGCTDFLTFLYFEAMNHSATPFSMDGKNEDLFFLSNGHISPVWYSILARSGYFPVAELGTFRKLSSRLQGHPSTDKKLPGIRMASGSLGQGLSNALGAAQTKKLNNDPKTVFVLMGDGELQEGQNWEALMYAAAKGVDNIIATVDLNGKQIDGTTDDVLHMGDVAEKFKAFGWDVLTLKEGNNVEKIIATLATAKSKLGRQKPIIILMETEMGNGVDFMMHTHAWHGKAPNDEQLENALAQNIETLGDY